MTKGEYCTSFRELRRRRTRKEEDDDEEERDNTGDEDEAVDPAKQIWRIGGHGGYSAVNSYT